MLEAQATPPKQILLRLPADLAAELANAVPPRQRNRYIVQLLSKDLQEKERARQRQLIKAAECLNAAEAADPELARESDEWLQARLTEDDDEDFDQATFERQFKEAQARRAASRKSTS